MAQFIPSSFVRWARSSRKARPPNLDSVDDAILSVGHYLKDHGWRKKVTKSHLAALLKYNNSTDYAKAIMKLADGVVASGNSKRTPATSKASQ